MHFIAYAMDWSQYVQVATVFHVHCMVDIGATNILLDMSMIPSEATGVKTTSVTLAIGQQQASVWRAEIFADGVKTTLMPIGRCCELLDLTFDASPSQTEMLRKALWTEAAHTDLKFDSGWFEKGQHGRDCVCVCVTVWLSVPQCLS
eukprot:6490419-Amphidinium_carterae.6